MRSLSQMSRPWPLLHFPGVAGVKQLVEITGAALGDYVFNLLVHDVLIARQIIPRAENAQGRGESWAVLHVGEQKSVGRPGMVRVMHDEVGFGDAVAEWDDFNVAVGLPAD